MLTDTLDRRRKQIVLSPEPDELGGVTRARFDQEIAPVRVDGGRTQPEGLRDFLARMSFRDQF